MNALVVPAALLFAVALSRFIAIAGIDPTQYAKVLTAFAGTGPRMLIFGIQFVGVAFFALRLSGDKRINPTRVTAASVALLAVSVARFFFPIFLVSLIGDLLTIWWFKRDTVSQAGQPVVESIPERQQK